MNFVKNNFSKRRESNNPRRRNNQPNRGRGQQPVSTLDPRLFVKKAVPLTEARYESNRSINDLPVDARIKTNLTAKGYSKPTEIQDKTLESILNKSNLLGIAQTGTGKTGAFLIPVMRSSCFIGGTSVGKDIATLRQPVHVVIGTPGRLTDLARQGALRLNNFNTLILDEFDRLLDMGFSRDIQFIVKAMSNRKQTILFSATEEKNQQKIISDLLHQPVEVRVAKGKTTGDHIEQEVVRVEPGETKIEVLLRMVKDRSFHKVIVFAETKRGVSTVRKTLHQSGVRVDEIHGNKSQNYRLKALNDFKSGKIQVLIATDVAARGLDISEVTHVINYQQPRDFDSYIHRIGRTGRAGKGGKAFTFIN